MTASTLIQFLQRAGWQEVRQQGIHRIFSHPDHANVISVPDMGEQFLQPAVVNDIAREAGLPGRVHRIRLSPAGIMNFFKNLLGSAR
jgi:predicted RNA binding protein YcfA (HicA-like mRNA interferase family)